MREVTVSGEADLRINGINNAGQMSAHSGNNNRVFRVSTSGQTDTLLNTDYNLLQTISGGINENGEVAIWGYGPSSNPGQKVSCWNPGLGITSLGVPTVDGWYEVQSYAINNSRIAVGRALYTRETGTPNASFATLYSPAIGMALNPGYWDGYNMAKDIDEAGNIVGCVNLDPILWRPDGTFVDLTQPNTYGAACSISSSGLISGTLNDATGKHLAIWNLSGQLLHKIYIGNSSAVNNPLNENCFMNDNGEVVATAIKNGVLRDYFWSQSSGLVDITNNIINRDGFNLTVKGINNRREIIAVGYRGNVEKLSLLLTPVPEPSAFAVMAAGLTALLLPHRRKKKR